MTINQRNYIEKVLKCLAWKNVDWLEPYSMRIQSCSNFLVEEFGNVQIEMEGVLYKAVIGSLMYAIVDL